MKIFVSGLVNIETTVAVRGFPIEYYPIDFSFFGVNSNVSGVGYNVSKALSTLGDEVVFCSYAGSDEESERVIARMEKDGISSRNILHELKATPASAVLYDKQGKRQIYCDLKDIQDMRLSFDRVKPELEGCDAAVLCNIAFNRGILRGAKDMGIPVATDVHVLGDIDDDYNRDFMENSDILFMSDEKLPCAPAEFIRQVGERYHNRVIVIGMGGKGAMLLDRDAGKLCTVPAYTGAQVVNTVGAGDALFSSFLHYYIKGMSAEQALESAVVFAGIKIGYSGASLGFSDEKTVEEALLKG